MKNIEKYQNEIKIGLDYLLWALTLTAVAIAIFFPLIEKPGTSALMLTIPFALIHGIRRFGWKLTLCFFVTSILVSNFFENLSILTGFPFGHYYYTGALKIIYVPVFIGPIYFSLGYMAWMIASTILDRADQQLDLRILAGKINVIALPILAAAVMTMFDVGNDSVASTIEQNWIWLQGGGIFGVPYTNYIGWWFVAYVYLQIFALVLAYMQSHSLQTIQNFSISQLQPLVIYLSLGLSSASYYIMVAHESTEVADKIGQLWRVADIAETMMIINLFSMIVIVFITLVKLVKQDIKPEDQSTYSTYR